MARVGFIGLGIMGGAVARHLLALGYEVLAFARHPDVRGEFEEAGAVVLGSCAEVAENAQHVLISVTNDVAVEDVVLSSHGVAAGASHGTMLIDLSTISPFATRRIGERLAEVGASMVDAPVSGGPARAENGSLTIMVGGSPEEFQRANAVLRDIGDRVFHVGPLGAGQTMKLLNQIIGGGAAGLMGEAVALARAAKVDLRTMCDVLAVSSGNSNILSTRWTRYLTGEYAPGFKIELMHKDLGLVLEMAQRLRVPTPLVAASHQQYTAALSQGRARDDIASLVETCARAAGLSPRCEHPETNPVNASWPIRAAPAVVP